MRQNDKESQEAIAILSAPRSQKPETVPTFKAPQAPARTNGRGRFKQQSNVNNE